MAVNHRWILLSNFLYCIWTGWLRHPIPHIVSNPKLIHQLHYDTYQTSIQQTHTHTHTQNNWTFVQATTTSSCIDNRYLCKIELTNINQKSIVYQEFMVISWLPHLPWLKTLWMIDRAIITTIINLMEHQIPNKIKRIVKWIPLSVIPFLR